MLVAIVVVVVTAGVPLTVAVGLADCVRLVVVGLTVGPAVIVVRMMVVLVTVASGRLRLRLLSGERVLGEEGAGPGPAGGQEAEEHLDSGQGITVEYLTILLLLLSSTFMLE